MIPLKALALLLLVACLCSSKIIKKSIALSSLAAKPETLFITKFDIGRGTGNFSITFRKNTAKGAQDFDKISLKVGLLKDTNYAQFRERHTCEQKQELYSEKQLLALSRSNWASTAFKITEEEQEHIWYLYIYDCESQVDKKSLMGTFEMEVTMFNNDSHFGQDEDFLLIYVLLNISWVGLMVRLFMPVVRSINRLSTTWAEIIMYCSFPLLGLAYFYRLLDEILIWGYGEQINFLLYLYMGFKNIIEGVMVTIIVSIAWGWSLMHLRHEPYYVIVGTVVTIINFIGIFLDNNADQIEQAHHHYDRLIGFMVLLIRLVIFALFVVGIFRSMAQSVGKRRHFLIRFGYLGGIFLVGWPVAVVLAQLFLPNYLHNEFVTLVEEGVYIVTSVYLCQLFAFPSSDFQKVSIKDDEMLPDYIKKQIR